MSPLYHHLYSVVCSESILRAFHYRVFLRESPESARDYNFDQLIYGIKECYGSIVVEDGDVFVLVNEDYFCHKHILVAGKLSFKYLVY